MKRTKVAAAAAVLLAGAMTVVAATSASADFTPQTRDIVGTGSDTTEISVTNVADGAIVGGLFTAGYNATAGARLVSFNALNPSVPSDSPQAHDTIVLKAGTAGIVRPGNSGAGKNLLFGATNNTAANFARSSGPLNAAEVAGGLRAYAFAIDNLGAAVSTTTNAPANLTAAQLVNIYNGTTTNWNQIGGASGTIVPFLPPTGSGTRSFFLAQLKIANGGVDVPLVGTIQTVQEHNPDAFVGQPNAVAPFSKGRAGLANAVGKVRIEGGFSATRTVYNVVRDADNSKPFVTSLFVSNGFFCSAAATDLIASGGLVQLAVPLDGGACGTSVTSTADNTNFLTN